MRDINPGYPGAPEHRSIRNVPVSGRRHPNHPHAQYDEYEDAPRRRPRRKSRWWMLALIAVVIFALAGFLLSTVFAGATVTVHPRQVTVDAPATVEARLSAPVGSLEYKEVSASRDATLTVASSGTQQVSRQASGVVTISNTFSAEPQRLIANTRFEAPDGKIYRIRDSVTVPGMKGAVAGSVTATIYADSPGESYNKTAVTSFTIPGFKGDPRHTTIVAKSTGGITGGKVGTEAAISAADLAKARDALQKKLDADARTAVTEAIPEGWGLLPGTLVVTYSELNQTPSGEGKVVVAQTATAKGAIVNGNDLGTAIARAMVEGYNGESVALIPDALDVTASTTGEGVLRLAMSGKATLLWQFDAAAVRTALLGKQKSEFQQVLGSFAPAIECTQERPCDVRIRPFWTGTFPSDPGKITILTP